MADPANLPSPYTAAADPADVVQFDEWKDHRDRKREEDAKKKGGGGGGPPGRGGADEPSPSVVSEDALALALAERIRDDCKFVPEWDCWVVWDGKQWKKDIDRALIERARENCREYSNQEAKTLSRAIESDKFIQATARLARSDKRLIVRPVLFERSPDYILNTPDAMYDLRTGTPLPHRREAYVMGMTSVAPAGVSMEWEKFVREFASGDTALVDYLQRLAGYFLSGFVMRRAWFFFVGIGGEGKSLFLNALVAAMDPYAGGASIGMFAKTTGDRHTTEIDALRHFRLVVANDIPRGETLDEAKIKLLTGSDRVATRVSRGDPVQWDTAQKLAMTSNDRPQLYRADKAIGDRLDLIPCLHIPSPEAVNEELRYLFRYDETQRAAILNWMIKGACMFYAAGKKLHQPACVVDATQQYLIEQNQVQRWLLARCKRVDDANQAPVATTQAYKDFTEWQEAVGERKWREQAFTRVLKEIEGISRVRFEAGESVAERKQKRGWRGFVILAGGDRNDAGLDL